MVGLRLSLRSTEDNAVLFTPLHCDLSKFGLPEPIPSVPQVVFSKKAFEQAEGARAANGAMEIIPQLRLCQRFGEAVHDGPLVDVEFVWKSQISLSLVLPNVASEFNGPTLPVWHIFDICRRSLSKIELLFRDRVHLTRVHVQVRRDGVVGQFKSFNDRGELYFNSHIQMSLAPIRLEAPSELHAQRLSRNCYRPRTTNQACSITVAVGTIITERPPAQIRTSASTHTALTKDDASLPWTHQHAGLSRRSPSGPGSGRNCAGKRGSPAWASA